MMSAHVSSPSLVGSHDSSDRFFLIEYLMAEEIVARGREMSSKEWRAILNTYEENLNGDIEFNSTCAITSLGLACSIVGASCTSKFNKAFCLLVSWERVGGAYWVVQRELIRHYLLPLMINQRDTPDKLQVSQWLDTVESCTANDRLKRAIIQLQLDLTGALTERTHCQSQDFLDYTSEYPIHKFIPWCVDWMVEVLSKALSTTMKRVAAHTCSTLVKVQPSLNSCQGPLLQKPRRKRQRSVSKPAENDCLFANIAALSYEDDTEDTTEMPETVKLTSFLHRKEHRCQEEDSILKIGESEMSTLHAQVKENKKESGEHGDVAEVMAPYSSPVNASHITQDHQQYIDDMPSKEDLRLSQRSTIVSDSSSGLMGDSDASIASNNAPRSLFGLVEKAIWRVM